MQYEANLNAYVLVFGWGPEEYLRSFGFYWALQLSNNNNMVQSKVSSNFMPLGSATNCNSMMLVSNDNVLLNLWPIMSRGTKYNPVNKTVANVKGFVALCLGCSLHPSCLT